MNFEENSENGSQQRRKIGEQAEIEALELELKEVLTNFRSSMHAWCEAASSLPRTEPIVRRQSWRLAASWALGCAIAAGSVSSVVYQQHKQEMAKVAAVQAKHAADQKLAAEQIAREEEEDLLAKVDSDVSREVPSAMEPLAQLMAEDDAK